MMGCNLDLLTSFKDNCGFGLVADMKNRPSHKNLEDAITSLERMMHRGAVAADGKTGDGSGLLLSMPDSFMRKVATQKGVDLPEIYAVAMIFTRDLSDIDTFNEYCEINDLKVLLIRLDLGMPLRKPFYPEKERWVLNSIDVLSGKWRRENLILNIAIGYPF